METMAEAMRLEVMSTLRFYYSIFNSSTTLASCCMIKHERGIDYGVLQWYTLLQAAFMELVGMAFICI